MQTKQTLLTTLSVLVVGVVAYFVFMGVNTLQSGQSYFNGYKAGSNDTQTAVQEDLQTFAKDLQTKGSANLSGIGELTLLANCKAE